MRKRSASESGRGNSPPSSQNSYSLPGKLRKVRHSSNKPEGTVIGSARRKANNLGCRKRIKSGCADDGTINSRHCPTIDSSNFRRSTPTAGTSDEGPLTREGKKSLSNYEAKSKQDPLPDIMHDWEIIVKSLRESTTNGEALTEPVTTVKESPKSASPKTTPVKSFPRALRSELTDSDKENSLRKKSEEFATPISLSPKRKLKPKPEKSPKINSTESTPEDLSLTWRRPTRSTYKAFEDVFDPSLIEDSEKEKMVAAPVIKEEKCPTEMDDNLEQESLDAKPNVHHSTPKRILNLKRSRKLAMSKGSGKRRMTRQMEKEGIKQEDLGSSDSSDSETPIIQSITENLGKECTVSLVKLKSVVESPDQEMDFLGFGSPPKSKRYPNRVNKLNISPLIDKSSLQKKGKVGRPKRKLKPVNVFLNGNSEREVIEECKLEESEEGLDTMKDLSHYDADTASIFSEEKRICYDFEGFTELHPKGRCCLSCSLLLKNMDALREHRKVGHRRIYSCLFDSGHCGQLKGSVEYGSHLVSSHRYIVSRLSSVIQNDIKSGKLAEWSMGEEPCCVCLVPLYQPGKCLHEMLIHGIWPPSLINLVPFALDQYLSLWWTGKNVAFACHLCQSAQTTSKTSAPIITSSPHAFPDLVANHLRNVHLVNVPLTQGWWILIRLLLSLPCKSRRTLSTLLSLSKKSELAYSTCIVCSATIGHFTKINLVLPYGLCAKCDFNCNSGIQCWYQCNENLENKSVLRHMVENHESRIAGHWCLFCGSWVSNILSHLLNCSHSSRIGCIFCNKPIVKLNIIQKAHHTLAYHSFPCPLPNCFCPLEKSNDECQWRFPTSTSLLEHLEGQHFPEWQGMTLEGIGKLLHYSKIQRGYVLTATTAKDYIGSWLSISGHAYSLLADNSLSLVKSVQVVRKCTICFRNWERMILHHQNNVSGICDDCSCALQQWAYGDPSSQCPIFSCLNKMSSVAELRMHLVSFHNLSRFDKNCNSICCSSVSEKSPISNIVHNLLCHHLSCLVCHFTAASPSLVYKHQYGAHGFGDWASVLHYLQKEESINKHSLKGPFSIGVTRIWQGDSGIKAQYDPTVDISSIIFEEVGKDPAILLNQSSPNVSIFDHGNTTEELNEVDPWCSSLCAVSMSPCKVTNDNNMHMVDRDIQHDVGNVTKKIKLSDMNGEDRDDKLSTPDLLVPAITVEEDHNIKSSNTDDIDSSDAGSIKSNSSSEAALEIDSSVLSPELMETENDTSRDPSKSHGNEQGDSNCFTVTIPPSVPSTPPPNLKKPTPSKAQPRNTAESSRSKDKLSNDTETPQFELMDKVNMMVAETLHSMRKAFNDKAPGEAPVKKNAGTSKHNQSKKDVKDLGENAFFDEVVMAENILKDLEEKFSSSCLPCGVTTYLPDLLHHLNEFHKAKVIYCQCGFRGAVYPFLVHSFHMSHVPCEARPILLGDEKAGRVGMIVLEARPERKAMTFPCFKCGKRFKQEKSRQLHYNLCKLEKKFTCDLCGEKFALENHLIKHKEWKHNPQTCQHCKKVFNSSSSLAQHILHIHKKQLGHHCKQCNDSFNTLSQLKVHFRTHTGEEPHGCHLCNLKFISKNLLRKHLASDHRVDSSSDDSEYNTPVHPNNKLDSTHGTASSDSSSDESDSGRSRTQKKLFKVKDAKMEANLKNLPLTESDLETSVSESEQVVMPKKIKPLARSTLPKSQDLAHRSPLNNDDKGSAGANIVLPELRDEVKERVKSAVGKLCNPCGQEFDTPSGKLLHMYLIHPGFALSLGLDQCCFCNHKFTSADDVSDHHLTTHQRMALPNGNFRCLCGITFREDGAYYFHLYYAHKAQRALNVGGEIVCRLCEGRPRLNKIVDLVVHLSDRHTMFDHVRFNDSYMCNFCYKAFESWTVLSLHFFMVHKATKSQTLSYDCPYCQGASPWHSLEALQYHLDNVHRGRHDKSQPIPEHTRGIYTPAPAPSSPTKTPVRQVVPKRQRKPRRQIKSTDADPEVLYCTCQCPYDEVSDMIGCDNINCKYQWFHFECVGIMAAPEGNWYCPDCASMVQQKQKEEQRKNQIQADLYEYYSTFKTDDKPDQSVLDRSRRSSSSNSSSSGSSSSSSSNSSSSSSSSSDSGSESEAN